MFKFSTKRYSVKNDRLPYIDELHVFYKNNGEISYKWVALDINEADFIVRYKWSDIPMQGEAIQERPDEIIKEYNLKLVEEF